MSTNSASHEGMLFSSLRRMKKTKNGILAKLADSATRALDMRSQLGADQINLNMLALRAAEVTESILSKAPKEEDHPFSSKLKDLQECIDGINMFLQDQENPSTAKDLMKLIRDDRIKAEMQAKDKRLSDVLIILNAELLMNVMTRTASLTEAAAQARSETMLRVTADLSMTRLPPKPRIFHGRDDIVRQIVSLLLQPDSARLALVGMGGIGKTSTAAMALHDSEVKAKYGENILFLSCESITTADGIVSALAAISGFPVLEVAELRTRYIRYLSCVTRPMLLVLDNLETAWDTTDQERVEEFLAELAGQGTVSLIITMRGHQRPVGVDWSQPLVPPLDTLDLDSSRKIFIDNGGRTDERLDILLQELEGWPLAIVLMAYQGQTLTPTELLAAYQEERTGLMTRGRGTRLTSVDVSISLSMASPMVQDIPEAHELLDVLCLLPDGIEDVSLRRALRKEDWTPRALRALEHAALVSRSSDNELKVLSPIRTFILAGQPTWGECLVAVVGHYLQTIHELLPFAAGLTSGQISNEELAKKALRNFGNMASVMSLLLTLDGDWEPVHEDCLSLVYFLASLSQYLQYGDLTELLEKAIVVGRKSSEEDVRAETAQISFILFTTLMRQGHTARAAKLMQEANLYKIKPEMSLDSRIVLLDMQFYRLSSGTPLEGDSDPKCMLEMIREVVAEAAERVEEAEAQGDILERRRRTYKEDALALQAKWDSDADTDSDESSYEDGLSPELRLMQCRRLLGRFLLRTGQWEEGLSVFHHMRQELEIREHEGFLASTSLNLGIGALLRYKGRDAEEYFRAALSTFRNHEAKAEAAEARGLLKEAFLQQRAFDSALAEMEDSGKNLEDGRSPLESVIWKLGKGRVLRLKGEPAEGLILTREACSSLESFGMPLYVAHCRLELYWCLEAQGHVQEGLVELQAALEECETLKIPQAVAICKYLLGKVLASQNTAINTSSSQNLSETGTKQSEHLFKEAYETFKEVTMLHPAVSTLLGEGTALERPLASICKDWAVLCLKLGNHSTRTLQLAERAVKLYSRLEFELETARCKVVLAAVLGGQGWYGQALALLKEAQRVFQDEDDEASMQECKQLLSMYITKRRLQSIFAYLLLWLFWLISSRSE